MRSPWKWRWKVVLIFCGIWCTHPPPWDLKLGLGRLGNNRWLGESAEQILDWASCLWGDVRRADLEQQLDPSTQALWTRSASEKMQPCEGGDSQSCEVAGTEHAHATRDYTIIEANVLPMYSSCCQINMIPHVFHFSPGMVSIPSSDLQSGSKGTDDGPHPPDQLTRVSQVCSNTVNPCS